ncbi:SsgA family sporulation/cell division regulator [Streptomyces formicae]|uniref:SsgA family sporulation/cell division regulator n=1 Tax=Streptomyces formicae TaxID=1616117 RepID=A0ABY3WPC4_9ACTN|nr:SsgA family sporulation/cell division regulator [Streptomyces formicae]UNM13500.1 SsgA family sporulation/cell division regulator [Streptomyces formicae]
MSTPVDATFCYDVDDPFVVRAEFRPMHDSSVTWDLGRDLLDSGTKDTAGAGEVRVWPLLADRGDNSVFLRIGPPRASALFEIDLSGLRAWLRRTYLHVPRGSEADRIDWGALARRLLTDS